MRDRRREDRHHDGERQEGVGHATQVGVAIPERHGDEGARHDPQQDQEVQRLGVDGHRHQRHEGDEGEHQLVEGGEQGGAVYSMSPRPSKREETPIPRQGISWSNLLKQSANSTIRGEMTQKLLTGAEVANSSGPGDLREALGGHGPAPEYPERGKRRRFDPIEVERFLKDQTGAVQPENGPEVEGWLELLLSDCDTHQMLATIYAERARLGAWWKVAESLSAVLEEIGERWAEGRSPSWRSTSRPSAWPRPGPCLRPAPLPPRCAQAPPHDRGGRGAHARPVARRDRHPRARVAGALAGRRVPLSRSWRTWPAAASTPSRSRPARPRTQVTCSRRRSGSAPSAAPARSTSCWVGPARGPSGFLRGACRHLSRSSGGGSSWSRPERRRTSRDGLPPGADDPAARRGGPVRQRPRLRHGRPAGAGLRGGAGNPHVPSRARHGSYTLAAALAGAAGSGFLDRFDRRAALAVAMAGLVLATAAGGLATGLGTLLAARVAAGLFGGPATSLAFAIVADSVPPERRGRAMGVVMGAFSVATVVGVPAGLWMAQAGGGGCHSWPCRRSASSWQREPSSSCRPCAATWCTPGRRRRAATPSFASRPPCSASAPPPRPWPRPSRSSPTWPPSSSSTPGSPGAARFLYMVGGALSFAVLRVVGHAIDRFGAPRVAAVGTAVMLANLALDFVPAEPMLPAWALFVLFILANSFRNPALSTLASRVPGPRSGRASSPPSRPSSTWPRRGGAPVLGAPRHRRRGTARRDVEARGLLRRHGARVAPPAGRRAAKGPPARERGAEGGGPRGSHRRHGPRAVTVAS